jgi:hypothetical protein
MLVEHPRSQKSSPRDTENQSLLLETELGVHAKLRCTMRWLLLLVAHGNVLADTTVPASPPPMADVRTGAVLSGTVVWSGKRPPPEVDTNDCEIHYRDVEGRNDINGGLGGVVLIAEPLDEANASWFRAHPPRDWRSWDLFEGALLSWWPDSHEPMASVQPGVPLEVETKVALRFYAGDRVVATLTPKGDGGKVVLPEGIVRVADDNGHTGWVYVSPWPMRISGGNCRFSFHLPPGRYRLTGWHPHLGARSRKFSLSANAKFSPLRLMVFGGQ